ncbi:MAG: glutathione S-transferase family protein [Deltaproteobacteria bacterium]|nr:glutathione S-transferase family protein [Deltaproteobacteria bacterium]
MKWLLGELGITADVAVVNVFAGEGRTPAYQAVHPHGFVPALEDEGVTLIESGAICMYLTDRYGEGKGLAPKPGTLERGKYYEWMVYVPATVDPCLEAIMFNTMFLPEEKRDAKLVLRMKKTWATKIEPRFIAALSTSPFILGETFSTADVMAGNALAWARMAGTLGDDPALARYLDAMASRPAFLEGHAS